MARDTSRQPVFDVMVLLNANWGQPQLADVHIKAVRLEHTTSKFDLTFGFAESGQGLDVTIEYDTDLFDPDRIERMGQHLQVLVGSIVQNPQVRIADAEILPEWEKRKLLVEFNDTAVEYPRDKTVHQLFEEQVERAPDKVAVIHEQQQLTYAQLNRKANQLARLLRKKGVGRDQLVAIMVDRSLEVLVGILGVLKAGGAYVPIDPDYPAERIRFTLQDCGARVVITQTRHLASLADFAGEAIDLNAASLYRGLATNPERINQPTDLVYVIYTSGSTGQPKGVMIEHHGLVNYAKWAARVRGALRHGDPAHLARAARTLRQARR